MDRHLVPILEGTLANLAREISSSAEPAVSGSWEALLDPVIQASSYELWRKGHLREAVLNSMLAIMDLLRERTRLALDGDALITTSLSVARPLLVLSELTTESGRNDQVGFMQILQGAYRGIRNPKAHSLGHDLTPEKAAQYLIFASLLARRVAQAQQMRKDA